MSSSNNGSQQWKGKLSFISVGSKFRTQLNELMVRERQRELDLQKDYFWLFHLSHFVLLSFFQGETTWHGNQLYSLCQTQS